MILKVEIATNGAAFEDNREQETALVLRKIATKVAHGELSGGALDTNGNTVATFWFEDDE